MVGVVRDRSTLWIGEAEGAAVSGALVFLQLYHLDDVHDARIPAVGRRAAAGGGLVACLGAGAEQGRRCQAPHAAPTRIDAELVWLGSYVLLPSQRSDPVERRTCAAAARSIVYNGAESMRCLIIMMDKEAANAARALEKPSVSIL